MEYLVGEIIFLFGLLVLNVVFLVMFVEGYYFQLVLEVLAVEF